MTETAPTTTTGNPFSLIAYVLFKVRHALEDPEANRPPRWVRIARGRQFQGEQLIGFVRGAVGGLASATSYMAELTLDIEELLVQTDAAKAIAETSLELIAAATSPDFVVGINTLLGTPNETVAGVFGDINQAANNIQGYLGYIPEPHDVRQLGHELYRLLCIVQQPLHDAQGQVDTSMPQLAEQEHLDLSLSGKVRLCAWAHGLPVRARGLGPNEAAHQDLARLGARRLFVGGPGAVALAPRARMVWPAEDGEIDLFDFTFTGAPGEVSDLAELVALLTAHGYVSPAMPVSPVELTPAIVTNLLRFQHLNGLPTTGLLDNATLNRLHNLDFAGKNLRRAVPYRATQWPWADDAQPEPLAGELPLVNGGADQPERESLTIVATTPYPYYVVRTTNPAPPPAWTAGWIAETPGFVALASRAKLANDQNGRLDGGKWSEGEAAQGRFFWAARHVEPWRAGRSGTPVAPLFGGPPPAVSRMYQWIPLPGWLTPPQPGAALYVHATVLQRALWSDRNSSGFPDQGLILLEAYPAGAGHPEGAPGAVGYVTNVGPRVAAASVVSTELFPSHHAIAAADALPEIDRRRLWTLRRTPELAIDPAAGIVALCLVIEGHHRNAFDTDAYFDDLRVYYEWRLPGGGV